MPLQLVFWAINKHDVWLAGGGVWPKSSCWNITIYKIWHLRQKKNEFQTNILRGSKSYHRPSSATLGCIFYGWASPHYQEGSVSPQFVTLEQFAETTLAAVGSFHNSTFSTLWQQLEVSTLPHFPHLLALCCSLLRWRSLSAPEVVTEKSAAFELPTPVKMH